MGKDVTKIFGSFHKSVVDPAGVMPTKVVDPANLFDYDGKKVAAPAPAGAPMAMPDPDSDAVAAARRRKVAAMKSRGGRSSTIITGGNDLLGG